MKIPLLITFLLFAILSISTTISSRPGLAFHPCNTLIISSFSFSLPTNPNNPINPNNNPHHIIFTNLPLFPRHLPPMTDRPFRSYRPFLLPRSHFADLPFPTTPRSQLNEMIDLPLGFSSVRDRTKDILSVVASLLFGAACGALTAGTMYLIWSLFNYRYDSYSGVDAFISDDDEDDIFNPKKPHYVAIPAAPVVSEETVDVGAVAKETV